MSRRKKLKIKLDPDALPRERVMLEATHNISWPANTRDVAYYRKRFKAGAYTNTTEILVRRVREEIDAIKKREGAKNVRFEQNVRREVCLKHNACVIRVSAILSINTDNPLDEEITLAI